MKTKVVVAVAAVVVIVAAALMFATKKNGGSAVDSNSTAAVSSADSATAADAAATTADTAKTAEPKLETKIDGDLPAPEQEKAKSFGAKLEKSFESLPTKDDLKKLTAEEAHETPEIIQQAATDLGEIAEMIDADPALVSQGADFYKKCALKNSAPSSIRAMCFADLKGLGKKYGIALPDDRDFPEDIRALADKLDAN
jgi:hypothetical protein